MQVKTCPITVKTAGTHEGADEGIVEAIVAAYNVDSVGDQIIPGAFQKSLAKHAAAGNRLPFVWSHKSDDLDSYIGEVLSAEERPEGLWVRAQLDMDDPKAAKAYRLLKGRRVSQFSFAYTEVDARPATKSANPGALKELHELDIHECGPTMVGANQATALLGVKATKNDACPTCGHASDAKHADTLPAPVEQTADQAPVSPSPETAAPAATVDTSLEDRVAELVRAAVDKLLRDRPEVDAADQAASPTTVQNADDEATPAAAPAAADTLPAAIAPPAESTSVPAGPGTATGRQLPELELLQAEFDELTI